MRLAKVARGAQPARGKRVSELCALLKSELRDALECCLLLEAPGGYYTLRCDLYEILITDLGITHSRDPLSSSHLRGHKRGSGMTTMRCPHCGKDIDLIGQKELSEDYGLGPNPVAHQRSLGLFPEPVLSFGNRNMWLREDIEVFVEGRRRERVAKLIEDFSETLAALPETEREAAIQMLNDGKAVGPRLSTPRKRAHS